MSKAYQVLITETLQKTVEVRVESPAAARELVERNWNNSEYILDSDHFKGVDFTSVSRERCSER